MANISVKIRGSSVDSKIVSCHIKQSVGVHHRFHVVLVKEGDLLDLLTDWMGSPIEIIIECDDYKQVEFEGVITNASLDRSGTSDTHIKLIGFSPTILLDSQPHCATFNFKDGKKSSLKDVFEASIKTYSSKIQHNFSPAFSGDLGYTVQYTESHFAFLCRLAQMYGEWWFYDGKKLFLGNSSEAGQHDLIYGINVFNLSYDLNLYNPRFEFKTYNYLGENNDKQFFEVVSDKITMKGSKLDAQSEFGLEAGFKTYADINTFPLLARVKSDKELETIRDRHQESIANKTAILSGNSVAGGLKIGDEMNINAGDSEFDFSSTKSKYRIIDLVHNFADSSYDNEFDLIPLEFATAPMLSVRRPECRMQFARVHDNKDPQKMGRVQVKFLWQKKEEHSCWIRVSTQLAGKDSGLYRIPEIEEEVIVGFASDHPNYPFVLGSLHHGAAMPNKEWYSENNDIKILRTKSGIEIKIHDEEKEIIISNADAKNTITMNDDMIEFSCNDGGSKIVINGDEVEIISNNINIGNGSSAIKLTSSKADIAASKEVSITGSKIKLN